jgi:Flp pilus assembly protein TadG
MSLRQRLAEEGGYVRGLIIQAALAMTVLAFAINDGGQIVAAQVRAESVARAAATAAADTWYRLRKADQAKADATAAAAKIDPSATVTNVDIGENGSVTVRVEKAASTIVVDKVGFLKKFGVQVATDSETGPAPR